MQRKITTPDIHKALRKLVCFRNGKSVECLHSTKELASLLEKNSDHASRLYSYYDRKKKGVRLIYPIQYALRHCNDEVIDLLLRYGAVLPERAFMIAGTNPYAIDYLLKTFKADASAPGNDPILNYKAMMNILSSLSSDQIKEKAVEINERFKSVLSMSIGSFNIDDALNRLVCFRNGKSVEPHYATTTDLDFYLKKHPRKAVNKMRKRIWDGLSYPTPIEFALYHCNGDVIDLLLCYGAVLTKDAFIIAGANHHAIDYLLKTYEVEEDAPGNDPVTNAKAVLTILQSKVSIQAKKDLIEKLDKHLAIDWSYTSTGELIMPIFLFGSTNGLTLLEHYRSLTSNTDMLDTIYNHKLPLSRAYEYGNFAPYVIAIKSSRSVRDHKRSYPETLWKHEAPNLRNEAESIIECRKTALAIGLMGTQLHELKPAWSHELAQSYLCSYDSFVFLCYADEFVDAALFTNHLKRILGESHLNKIRFIHIIDYSEDLKEAAGEENLVSNREAIRDAISSNLQSHGCIAHVVIDRVQFEYVYAYNKKLKSREEQKETEMVKHRIKVHA